jgi:hypothetical protein
MEEMGNAYNILIGKPKRKGTLRKARHRWEDNIRMDLGKTEWKGVGWKHLAMAGPYEYGNEL